MVARTYWIQRELIDYAQEAVGGLPASHFQEDDAVSPESREFDTEAKRREAQRERMRTLRAARSKAAKRLPRASLISMAVKYQLDKVEEMLLGIGCDAEFSGPQWKVQLHEEDLERIKLAAKRTGLKDVQILRMVFYNFGVHGQRSPKRYFDRCAF